MTARIAWLVYLLVWCVIAWATSAWGGPVGFGWYDNAPGNAGDRSVQIREAGAYTTLTMSVQYWEPDDWAAARAAGQRVVLIIPDEVFWAVSDRVPAIPPRTLPLWCRPDRWCGKTLEDWIAVMETHRDFIAGILIADEVDCNSDDGTIRFPHWTSDSCRRAAAKLAVLHQAVKAWLPWVTTWTNYTAAWAYYFELARAQGRSPAQAYGVALAPTDYLSLDCYAPYDTCFGRASVSTLYSAWLPHLTAGQRFVLMPRAFSGPYLGWNPSDAEVVMMARRYEAYAWAEPRVAWIVPFVYRDVAGVGLGARSRPELLTVYSAMAARIRPLPLPGPPQNLRFVR